MDQQKITMDETPVNYDEGTIRIYTLDGEDCAEHITTDRDGKEIALRLNRDELVASIRAYAEALAALNG